MFYNLLWSFIPLKLLRKYKYQVTNFKGLIKKENKKLKSFSYQVNNDMETSFLRT